tara:strand:- start:128 stop:703 length:576 start_codon:yes stop_codon:yes gene_type:complete
MKDKRYIKETMLYEHMKLASDHYKAGKLTEVGFNAASRMYYDIIFSSAGKTLTGLASSEANDSDKTTDDHFTIPQWCGKLIVKHWDELIGDDFDRFYEMMKFNTHTIKVLKTQNDKLRTYHHRKSMYVKCSYIERYNREGIKLVPSVGKKKRKGSFQLPEPPKGFLEIEKRYITEIPLEEPVKNSIDSFFT